MATSMNLLAILSSEFKDRLFITKYKNSWPTALRDLVKNEYNATLAWDTDHSSPVCIVFETNSDLLMFTIKYGTEYGN